MKSPFPFRNAVFFFALSSLLAGGVMGLAGCGFRPLYGREVDGPENQTVNQAMQQVYVDNIPSRFGQTMRLALQSELAGSGPERPQGYILRAGGGLSYSAINIHPDNTSGRTQVTGWASWRLYKFGEKEELLAQGSAHTLDGFDPTIDQGFAQSLNSETTQKRVSEILARQIVQQVAVYFRAHIASNKIGPANPYADVTGRPVWMNNAVSNYQGAGATGMPSDATGRVTNTIETTEDDSDHENQPSQPE